MYTIYADDKLLFSSTFSDDQHTLISPLLSPDVNGAGSLTFTMPPGHALYDDIRRLKSIITVVEDGKLIFRGRALDDEKDFYNQKNVYCEGDRSFLLDSQCAPYTYSGTALGLFRKLIGEHNDQVDDEKKFVIGNVTAVSSSEEIEKVENVAYWETLKEFDEKLLSVYGGYLMTRTEGDVTYIDWLKEPGEDHGQVIEFSVNLLDLKDKVDASEVFTVLIPLGASNLGSDGEYTEPVTVESVNGGRKYIQNDDAVALYGKIWRTKTWGHVEDPAKLLARGREYLKTGIAVQTLTLKAVDINFINGDAKAIHVGDKVHILSDPHGLDMHMHCARIDIDLLNPENTTYTFGEAPRTLTENVVKAEEDVSELTGSRGGGGGRSVKDENNGIIRWAKINIDEKQAAIDMLTGEANSLKDRLSKAEIHIDGINAQIVLFATREETDELSRRMTAAEIEIDGANAEIKLKANATTVNSLGERVSAAELEIDGLNSEITLKADKVTIDAELTSMKKYFAGSATAAKMVVTNLTAMSMTFDGMKCKWEYLEIPTSVRIPALTGYNVKLGDDSTALIYAFSSTSRSCSISTDGITLMKAST